jgi:hypothetical protein
MDDPVEILTARVIFASATGMRVGVVECLEIFQQFLDAVS